MRKKVKAQFYFLNQDIILISLARLGYNLKQKNRKASQAINKAILATDQLTKLINSPQFSVGRDKVATYSEYIIELFFGMTKSTQLVTGIGPSKAWLDFPMQKESFSLPFGMAILL